MIPDRWRGAWICVDPASLERLARAADSKRPNWRELTRIAKTWNNRDSKFQPYIKPGLLLEVMAMDIVQPGFGPDLGTPRSSPCSRCSISDLTRTGQTRPVWVRR